MLNLNDYDEFEPIEVLDNLLEDLKELKPTVKHQWDEGYDWLESDEEWCAAIELRHPQFPEHLIQIELNAEFILYFRYGHIHYMPYQYEYTKLIEDVKKIWNGTYISCINEYDNNVFSTGFTNAENLSKDKCKDSIYEDVCFLANYEWELKPDGIYKITLAGIDPTKDTCIEFRLDELTDVKALIAQQKEILKDIDEL